MVTPSCPQEVQAVVTPLVSLMGQLGHYPMGPQENQLTHPAIFNLPLAEPFPVQRYMFDAISKCKY